MKIKYSYIVLILLVCMLAISAVSAAGDEELDDASKILSTNDNNEAILDESISDDVSTITDNEELNSVNDDGALQYSNDSKSARSGIHRLRSVFIQHQVL